MKANPEHKTKEQPKSLHWQDDQPGWLPY